MQLLGGVEISTPSGTPFFVVARTTLRGVNDAKPLTPGAAAVLLVADAPGKPPAEVVRQIRVLEGAARIIRVPWVPALRGMVVVPSTPAVTKVAAKVAAQLGNGEPS